MAPNVMSECSLETTTRKADVVDAYPWWGQTSCRVTAYPSLGRACRLANFTSTTNCLVIEVLFGDAVTQNKIGG